MQATLPFSMEWSLWLTPGLFLLGGLIFGWVLEILLTRTAQRILPHTSLELSTQTAHLLRGMIVGLFVLGGLYLATYNLPSLPFVNVHGLAISRKILLILAMLLSIRLTARVAVALVRYGFSRSKQLQALPNTSIFENILQILVYGLGLLVLLQTVGISIMPILTALGVGGLAISLALKETLENIVAGINMILARQIKVGDTVQLENGQAGVVQDIGWRTTVLKQFSGNRLIVPNNKLASSMIINYTTSHSDLTITLTLKVSLDGDLERIEALAQETATQTGQRLLAEKAPKSKHSEFAALTRYQSYGDSWVNLAISLPFKVPMDGGWVRHELLKALHARLGEEKITLPLPQQVVRIESTEATSA